MIYRVQHTTTYTYTDTVSVSHNELRLKPRNIPGQTCRAYELLVQPHPAMLSEYTDFFGNQVVFLAVQEPHRSLSVTAKSTVDMVPRQQPDPMTTPAWETVRDQLRHHSSAACLTAYQYTFDSPHIAVWPALRRFASASFPPGRPLLEAVYDLTRRIYTDFTYNPTATSVSTPLHEVLRNRHGVCQDFAHMQIGCLRALGLAARYVSGYLVTQPTPGQVRLAGADASHAWVSVYCPGHGWIDADPTNNVLPTDRHITVAYGRDYSDVTPIKGVFFGGGEHRMHVVVNVVPV
jgi:transglutaminase-like putative cysteine protease